MHCETIEYIKGEKEWDMYNISFQFLSHIFVEWVSEWVSESEARGWSRGGRKAFSLSPASFVFASSRGLAQRGAVGRSASIRSEVEGNGGNRGYSYVSIQIRSSFIYIFVYLFIYFPLVVYSCRAPGPRSSWPKFNFRELRFAPFFLLRSSLLVHWRWTARCPNRRVRKARKARKAERCTEARNGRISSEESPREDVAPLLFRGWDIPVSLLAPRLAINDVRRATCDL